MDVEVGDWQAEAFCETHITEAYNVIKPMKTLYIIIIILRHISPVYKTPSSMNCHQILCVSCIEIKTSNTVS